MDVSEILDGLNDKQREAVSAPNTPLLVLAGAGSGKTRVLVHRIAWLISVERISPYSIFAVTFTNKAAKEMQGRIEALLHSSTRGMWVGTFHGLAHRFLRAHYQEANLPDTFQIIDSDDQVRVIKRVMRERGIDEKQWPAKQAAWFINQQKELGVRPKDMDSTGDVFLQQMKLVYHDYQETCQRSGLIDFSEMLLRTLEMFKSNEGLLSHYRQRFHHFLVDEFQDTNDIQYQLMHLLAHNQRITVVGDDDQSIYGWRGAKVENIQKFEQDCRGAKTVRLEQNYRSSKTILHAANAVIKNNFGRLGKELWTDGVEGEKIAIYHAYNEQEEARYVAEKIREWQAAGNNYSDTAVLYRSNAQSRVIEEALLRDGIPYRIYGGFRFFERAEVKDTLAYMRLIYNSNDDAAFERVVNTPTRGIGERSMSGVREHARAHNLSLWQAAEYLVLENQLTGRAKSAIASFLSLVKTLDVDYGDLPLHQFIHHVIRDSGLFKMYQSKEKGEKWLARKENLEELVNAAREFDQLSADDRDDEGLTPLAAFLSHAALESGEDQAEPNADCVQMMTMHSAKGLEFPLVALVGMEENLFPHQMSLEDPEGLEEERRLCYVGITRAMQKLLLTHTERRRLYGKETHPYRSRFINEIPDALLEEVRPKQSWSKTMDYQEPSFSGGSSEQAGFMLGQRVKHNKFGPGTLLNFEGEGASTRVQVNFDDVGSKWLVLSYAKLEAC